MALDSCRSIGFNVGPVPWTAIEEYAILNGMDFEEKERFHYLTRMLDNVYLDHQRKK